MGFEPKRQKGRQSTPFEVYKVAPTPYPGDFQEGTPSGAGSERSG